jgi:hypothetical protein
MARVRNRRVSDVDLETIFHAEGSATAEVEALAIKTLLESNGIPAVIVGDSVLPDLPFEVRVARNQVERARQLIAEGQSKPPRGLKSTGRRIVSK